MADKQLVVTLIGNASSLKSAFGEAGAAAGQFNSRTEEIGAKLSTFGSRMTVGVTLPLVAGFTAATAAAAEDVQQQAVLRQALEQNVGATDDVVAATEEWITSMQMATGVADGELRVAMTELVNKGSDVAESQRIVEAALNLAAGAGVSFETAVTALAKAADGNTTALGRMGIQAGTLDEALQIVSETMGGSAAAAADTAAGRMAIAQQRMGEAAEEIGTALLPVLEKLAGLLSTVAGWFSGLSGPMQTAVIGFGLLLAAVGPVLAIVGKLMLAHATLKESFAGMGAGAKTAGLALVGIGVVITGLIVQHQQYKQSIQAVRDAITGLDAESAELAITQAMIEAGITDSGVAAAVAAVAYGTATAAQSDLVAQHEILQVAVDNIKTGMREEAEMAAAMEEATRNAGKAFIDATADAAGLSGMQKTLAEATGTATGAMQTQAETMRQQTDPAFAYLSALQQLRDANVNLDTVLGDVEASADDVAAAELDVVAAHVAVRDAGVTLRNNPDAIAAFRSAEEAAGIAEGSIDSFAGTLGAAFERGDTSGLRARLTGLSGVLDGVRRDVDAIGSAFGRLPSQVNIGVNVGLSGPGASYLSGRTGLT